MLVLGDSSDKLDSYKIRAIIGRGVYSSVYIANQTTIKKSVVIKRCNKDNDAYLDKIKREIEIIPQVTHPNIVEIIDVFSTDKFSYIVFPYYNGSGPLSSVNLNAYSLINKKFLAYLVVISYQIADAIEYLHSKSIIHRDIKPANIIISKTKTFLIDFNLSAIVNNPKYPVEPGIVESPIYIAPEIWRYENNIDYTIADIYSFGVTLYYLFNKGKPPYKAETVEELEQDLRYNNPALSCSSYQTLDRLINAMISKDPTQRPKIDEIKKKLKKYINKYGVAEMDDFPDIFLKRSKPTIKNDLKYHSA